MNVDIALHCAQRKTGECFGLNGLIFLGSILLWDYGLAPGMQWLLQAVGTITGCPRIPFFMKSCPLACLAPCSLGGLDRQGVSHHWWQSS